MALARGTSTTQVTVINTSSNFILTAVLGYLIFTERLPPLWWLGAALLMAGSVIIGRRDETNGDRSSLLLGEETVHSDSGSTEMRQLLSHQPLEPRHRDETKAVNSHI